MLTFIQVLTTGPKVEWVHAARWVHDGKYWTSSGVSAGIDVAYAWLEEVYGKGAADYIAMSGEYRRWTNASDDPFAEIWGTSEVKGMSARDKI